MGATSAGVRVGPARRSKVSKAVLGRDRGWAGTLAQATHDHAQTLAPPFLPGPQGPLEPRVERGEGQQAPVNRSVRRPEAREGRHEPRQRRFGVGLPERIGQVPHPTLAREIVEQRLEQLAPRAEPLVHGDPRDAGSPGDGLDTELRTAPAHEQCAGGPQNAGPGAVDRRLAAAQPVGPGGHGTEWLDGNNLTIHIV